MGTPVAIIAIGSELLSGQILNRNAAWLAERLTPFGFATKLHLTVDDVEGDIVAALRAASEVADLLITTGGLGPTTDDLTRQAVAKWLGEPLRFDPASWEHCRSFFARLRRDVPETNKQQCYFPNSARVLTNNAGTANAFTLQTVASATLPGKELSVLPGKELWVLPGPPREVEEIWLTHMAENLKDRVPKAERMRQHSWRTLGKGESHLAEIIEPLVRDPAYNGVNVAYRAHIPYVELKIRFPEVEAAQFTPLCRALDAALKPWIYEVDNEDMPRTLVRQLREYAALDIYDGITQGNLMELLGPLLREGSEACTATSLVTSFESHDDPAAFVEQALDLDAESDVALAIAGFDSDGMWAIGLRRGTAKLINEMPSIYSGEALRSRNLKAIAAQATKTWNSMLSTAPLAEIGMN